jgi:hypothetical protein
MERKKVFITFGGPTSNFHNAVNRLCSEMSRFDYFDEIKGFTDNDLKQDPSFWGKHGDFIEQNRRGYGYWIWKPYIIHKMLNTLNEGDILVYADAGCVGNINGKPRVIEYVNMLDQNPNQYGILSFQMQHIEEKWTKKSIFNGLDCDEPIKNTGQCMATCLIIKKNNHSIDIINKWMQNMHYEWINDEIHNESPIFIENRHDQSIYSCIVKKYGSIKILDETWDSDWSLVKHVPILAMRRK